MGPFMPGLRPGLGGVGGPIGPVRPFVWSGYKSTYA